MAARFHIDPKATNRYADALAPACALGSTATMEMGFIVRRGGVVANGENEALVARCAL